MVAPRFRSRSLRRVFVKTPGGKTVLHHRRRKPAKAECAKCAIVLKGVPRDIPGKIKKLSKTQRRPERPYGGVLCSKCMRLTFIEKAKMLVKGNG
jgi:large subunit ribosomal protein L34e